MNSHEIIEKYVLLRDMKKSLQDKHKLELAPINEAMDGLESVMLNYFNEQDITSVATTAGTAYRSLRESFTVADPVEFRAWVAEQGDLNFFEARASKEAVSAYMETSGGVLPPGLKYNADMTIGVRRK